MLSSVKRLPDWDLPPDIQVYQGERATIPLRILKNRTVGFGSLVKFCVAAAYVSLLYFLPIYFQSVQRSSAIRSGVQTLPLIMAVIVFMTATGIMLLAGIGPGVAWIIVLPFIAASITLAPEDIKLGSVIVMFFQTLGGT
ncbi:unnamed protein product, partial [Tilletia caries]